jgi:hypothetical protein
MARQQQVLCMCDRSHTLGVSEFLLSCARNVLRRRIGPTSKMSHDLRRRGSCSITSWILLLHVGIRTIARDVTAKVVGSGALLAFFPDSLHVCIVVSDLELLVGFNLPQDFRVETDVVAMLHMDRDEKPSSA